MRLGVLELIIILVELLSLHKSSLSLATDTNEVADSSEVETFDSIQITGDEEATTNSVQADPQERSFPGVSLDDDGNGERDTEKIGRAELVEIKINVPEFPGENARMYGQRVNYSDPFENKFPVDVFLGVSFAEVAVKSLRYQRPVLKLPVSGFRALRNAEPCPQISAQGTVIGSEDCLKMNIFIPGENGDDPKNKGNKLPVLVWFHGESLERFAKGKFSVLSSGSAEDLQPDVFLQNKILVVTPQYRLGSLGFLSVANEDLNGNMGAFDQLLALEWVQRFIPSFGGDASQITVMGQGSSASTIGLLATSEMARGLFHRLILMSGVPISPISLDTNQKLTFAEIALQNSCPSFPTLQFVRCMQKRQAESIILADQQLTKGRHLGKFRSPSAVIQKEDDGRFLPPLIDKDPATKISLGRFETVPVIIGITSSEMSGFLPSLAGKPQEMLSSTIFSGTSVLKQFIRAILSRSSFGLDADLVAQLVSFEYFAGLNVSERQDQAKDLVEEMLSDYLFYMPALSLAKLWSRFATAHLYVFDYVPTGSGEENENTDNLFSRLKAKRKKRQEDEEEVLPITQAIHGSDLQFLMQGYKGSAQDREVANVMVDFWINFIHKGSPLQSGLEWPQYREDTKEFLFISDSLQVRSGFRRRQEQFWTELIKEVSERSCPRPSKGRANSISQTGGGGSYSYAVGSNPISSSEYQSLYSNVRKVIRQQQRPLIFEDVSPNNISKKFYTFNHGSSVTPIKKK
ncbi:unnamed protein product [Orchesella dallaii]|uniref:Carboxylesterase type B domain-containing protein n=1 Tax=Orchesella dallaii TaxID=48710 RepID=A0ABP1RB77_9HEXA